MDHREAEPADQRDPTLTPLDSYQLAENFWAESPATASELTLPFRDVDTDLAHSDSPHIPHCEVPMPPTEPRVYDVPFEQHRTVSDQVCLGTTGIESPFISLTEFKRVCTGMRLLSLFHGFHRPDDGLEHFATRFGVTIDRFDTEISSSHDLADESVWQPILDAITEGTYDGGGGGPPCSTFSAGRVAHDGGPGPLRGDWPPDLYGLSHISQSELEGVKLGTLLAVRMGTAFTAFVDMDRPVWAETPAERSGHPNVFHLPICMGLRQRTGVTTTQAAQCMLGARTSKLTDFLLFFIKLCVPPLCLHHSQWWR